MLERLSALLALVPNPFAQVRIGSAWDALSDVDSINNLPFRRCVELVGAVQRDGVSHGLMVAGLAGTGKTHLLARLRRFLVEQERGWFVYLPPVTAPDRFFRHTLQYLAADVLRTARQGTAATQLETAVARHLMADAGASTLQAVQWWRQVREQHTPGAALHAHLSAALEPLTEAWHLDGPVMRVLACHLAGVQRLAARDWLLGAALPEDDLRALGVALTLDDEESARRAVFTLLRLPAPGMVVVPAFDQIEGLQRSPEDLEPLVAFGLGVRALIDGAPNVLAVTCAQLSFLEPLRAALGAALFDGGLAEYRDSLQPLTPEQVHALVCDRLRRSDDLQTVRRAVRAAGDRRADRELWPLDEQALALGRADRPARDVLIECRVLFDACRTTPSQAPTAERPPAPSAPGAGLADLLAARLSAQQASAEPIDDGVYIDGLTRALDLLAPGVNTVPAAAAVRKHVDLEVRRAQATTAVSVCNARNMRSLAARCEHLQRLRGRWDRLVLIRDARLPVPPTAAVTNTRLAQLQADGVSLLRPPAEAYAALAALRRLLAEAAAGDLTLDARAVPVEELSAWLARHMPPAVRELCTDVLGDQAEPEPPTLAILQSALQEEGVLELSAAAERARLNADTVRQVALAHEDVLGYLGGPPEVLYLRVAGLRRE